MPTLHELAEKYGCDKLYSHSYIPAYEELFAGRTVHQLLELGIGTYDLMKDFTPRYIHGASLLMWRSYFPDATITGVDIVQSAVTEFSQSRPDRTEVYWCDVSKPHELLQLIGEIGRQDVIIDDASHEPEHQIISAITLLPYTRQIYVIEDCRDP